MKNSVTRSLLQLDNTTFTIAGQTGYKKDENGNYLPKVFHTNSTEGADGKISTSFVASYESMNVAKFGSTKITLYTFSLFGKKITENILIRDITILTAGEMPVTFEEKLTKMKAEQAAAELEKK